MRLLFLYRRVLFPRLSLSLELMKASLKSAIVSTTNSSDAKLVEVIQELWSGYGKIKRIQLQDATLKSVVVKNVFKNTFSHR